jgi:DNA-binding transcriptional LysR family regulator
MQLEALKIFCDVVRWASFSRGALENQISQSSASQAVHQLELRLGVKLIDRSKRPLVVTPQGKVYYEGCKDLVGRYLEVENRVKALEDEHNVVGTVRVASIYSVGLNHMSQYVRTFAELHPGRRSAWNTCTRRGSSRASAATGRNWGWSPIRASGPT